jgi:hypothetical protein
MENYPIFNKEYINEISDNITNNFKKYLHYTNEIVNRIEKESKQYNEIPLTFYPIAKNIRIVSSFMVKNILNGEKSYIYNKTRDGEEDYWINGKNMESWYPWLWARGRIQESYTNKEGWLYYFDSFNENNDILLESGEKLKPPDNLELFFLYLSCVKYTFKLNNNYKKIINDLILEINWPMKSKILAVQIRRGETCTKDCKISDRPCFDLDHYIEKIDLMLSQHNYEYIYISTDSDEEIEIIKLKRPIWKLLYLNINRKLFFRLNGESISSLVDLEVSCSKNINKIPFIVDTALFDLYFISKCHAYISTMSISAFSILGWYLQISEQEKLTPYINMNIETLDMTKKNFLLCTDLY